MVEEGLGRGSEEERRRTLAEVADTCSKREVLEREGGGERLEHGCLDW